MAGADIKVHWGLPDPTFHPGSEEERDAFCTKIAERIRAKVTRLANMRFAECSRDELIAKLNGLSAI